MRHNASALATGSRQRNENIKRGGATVIGCAEDLAILERSEFPDVFSE